MAYETPDHNMEMPTMCDHCKGWFDLNDGYESEKWHPNTTICKECSDIETKEIQLEDEIEEAKNEISDGEYTLKEWQQRLVKLEQELKTLQSKQ